MAFFGSPFLWGALEVDLARFARVLKGTTESLPTMLITNPTVADVRRLVRESKFIAMDIETAPAECDSDGYTGKDATQCRLKTVGLGNTEWGLSKWWGGAGAVEREIKSVLADSAILKIDFNGIWFDRRVLNRHGIDVRNCVDARTMRRALSATSQLSLRYVASIYIDYYNWKQAEEDGAK